MRNRIPKKTRNNRNKQVIYYFVDKKGNTIPNPIGMTSAEVGVILSKYGKRGDMLQQGGANVPREAAGIKTRVIIHY